jgi:ubiquinone biosynthesis protein COQ9
MSEKLEDAKRKILAAALPHVAFDGWSRRLLTDAAVEAGYDAAMARRAFPGGPAELVDFFIAEADRQMLETLEGMDLPAMKIRERIATAVRVRLEQQAPHREAVRRAVALQALPGNAPKALKALYRTVDAMWHAAGDTATDWNFYSKRMLLAGVYSTTLLHWLDDSSEGFAATWAFLDRRIGDIMQIQKTRGRLEKMAAGLPSPLKLMQSFASGSRRRPI